MKSFNINLSKLNIFHFVPVFSRGALKKPYWYQAAICSTGICIFSSIGSYTSFASRSVPLLFGAAPVAVSAPNNPSPSVGLFTDHRALFSTADYLPGDTLFYFSVPNPSQSIKDFQNSDIAQIAKEPEVQKFLSKPLAQFHSNQTEGLQNLIARLTLVRPHHIFGAVTKVERSDISTNKPSKIKNVSFIGGFQFDGKRIDVEQLFEEPKKQFQQKYPGTKIEHSSYKNLTIETIKLVKEELVSPNLSNANQNKDKVLITSVFFKNWYLISNDLDLLKSSVDRAMKVEETQRLVNASSALDTSSSDSSLSKDLEFCAVYEKMPKQFAIFTFLRVKPFLEDVINQSTSTSQPSNPTTAESFTKFSNLSDQQRAHLDKFLAWGMSTTIEQGKMKDTIFCLTPDLNEEQRGEHLNLAQTLSYTTPDTLMLLTQSFWLPDDSNMLSPKSGEVIQKPSVSEAPNSTDLTSENQDANSNQKFEKTWDQWRKNLIAHGLNISAFKKSFKQEVSLSLDWPKDIKVPSFLVTLSVRDSEGAATFFDQAVTAIPKSENFNIDKTPLNKGNPTCSLSISPSNSLKTNSFLANLSPTFALSENRLIFGLYRSDVQEGLLSEHRGETIAKNAATPTPTVKQPLQNEGDLPKDNDIDNEKTATLLNYPAFETASALVESPDQAFGYINTQVVFQRIYDLTRPFLAASTMLAPNLKKYLDIDALPKSEIITKHLSPIVLSVHWDKDGSIIESEGPLTLPQLLIGGVALSGVGAYMIHEQTNQNLPSQVPHSNVLPQHSQVIPPEPSH